MCIYAYIYVCMCVCIYLLYVSAYVGGEWVCVGMYVGMYVGGE